MINSLTDFYKFAYTLQPHQERAIKRLDSTNRLLLYHGLGAGKSLATLAAAERTGLPLTMIGPAAIKENIPKEMAKHKIKLQTQPKVYTYAKPPTTDPGGLVAIDEIQNLGRVSAQRSKIPDLIKGEKTMLLSGTPIRNYPEELIPLLRGLDIKAGRDPATFRKSFIKEIKQKPGFFAAMFKGIKPGIKYEAQNLPILKRALQGKVDYHMPSKEGYPSTSTEEINVVMTPEQNAAYKMALKKQPSLAYKIRKGIAPSKTEAKHLNAFLA